MKDLFQMKDPLLKGHPLHAILTDLPIGMHIAGNACDFIGLFTRRTGFRFAARAAYTGALVSGTAAGLVGLWDYQAVPQDTPARRIGALHAWLNGGVVGLLLTSVAVRSLAPEPADGRPQPLAIGLSTAGLALLGVSGWLGGDLVYRLGWRVSKAEEAEQLEDTLRQRGQTDLINQAQRTVQQYEQGHALLP